MTSKRVVWLLIPLCGVLWAGAAGVLAAPQEPKQAEDRVMVFTGRAWLGVKIDDVTAERAKELKLPGEYGVEVKDVEADSPAAQAGLQAGDVIVAFAEERVHSAAQLRRLVEETPVGRKVAVQVSRGGQLRSLEVALAERPAQVWGRRIRIPEFTLPRIEIPDFDFHLYTSRGRLGISGDELTPQLAEYFGVKQGKGVLVKEVLAGSPAAQAGLKAGDVIVRVDTDEVGDLSGLRRALARERSTREVTLTIIRDRREQALKVVLEEPKEVSPRRTAEVELDPAELDRLASQLQVEALKGQEQAREMQQRLQQQLKEHQLNWQKEWRQRWEQEQRGLKLDWERLQRELEQETGDVI